MADFSSHPTDALQDAIDGRLDAEARAALDVHLAACERCRREFDALRWTKAHVGEVGQVVEMPDDFDARLRRMLDAEDREPARPPGAPSSATEPRLRRWLLGSVAAAAAIVVALWLGRAQPPSPSGVGDHLRAFQAGELSLEIESSDLRVLEAHLRSTAAPAARVYDFGMMGFTLVGVRTVTLGDRPSALSAYRGTAGQALLCEMYVGRVEDLPPPVQRRTNEGIDFLVYRDGDITVVFWQEGSVVCVLAGRGDPEVIVRLAFAKAIKV